jgi:hypothetical protein
MALPQGFVLEDQPTQGMSLPSGFQMEEEQVVTKPRSEGGLGQLLRSAISLGRSTASLADVTVGGVLPAAAQMVGYPLARLGRSPEEAQAATQRLVSAVDKPFGKMAGVTETPEYQGEAGRQIMDFIGENFQKGAKWIADKTGIPASDVESYMASLGVATPAMARPAARTIQELATPALEKAVIGAKMPFEPMVQARRERMSLEDYARGPQIDAAREAQRLGIALSPEQIQPTLVPKTLSAVAGQRGTDAIANANKNQIRKIVINELGLPETTQFDSKAPFNQARMRVAEPYSQVKKLPTMVADDNLISSLNNLRPDQAVIGANQKTKAINAIIDDAISKTSAGLDGAQILKNVQTLRQEARKTYNNKSADLQALDLADTRLAIANSLEAMIESNIFNPKLLSDFRQARQKMAKTYAYEDATDFNTGMIDVNKLSRITSKDNAMTGDIAALGKIAGNFPDAFTTKATESILSAPRITRSGIGGTAGATLGYQLGGVTGSVLGTAAGVLAGEGAGMLASNIMSSPKYQAGLSLRDARIPVSQVATAAQPIPQSQAIVPYQAPVEVLGQGQGPYQPNFVIQPNEYGPRVTTPGFAPTPPQLPSPSAQGTLSGLRTEDTRRAGMSRTLGQQTEIQQAAVEASNRQPARGGLEFTFDAGGNLVPVTTSGAGGVLPTALESAIQKMSGQVIEQPSTSYRTQTISPKTGAKPYTRIVKKEGETTFERGVSQAFAMTAEEKIAWSKVKADLAEVVPGMKTLSNESILNRLQDVEWATDAVKKARDKAVAFEQIAARAKTRDAQQQAIANRERMLDLAEQMENTLRVARPDVSGKTQGPKTRAAFREGLLTNPPEPFKVEIRGTNRLLSGD